ncbi:MAG: hypothetical protein ACYTG5_19435 [Planctomycetota bacterium]|jgi:hypothetical protein
MRAAARLLIAGLVCTSSLAAQSFEDLTLVRNRPSLYSKIIKINAGLRGDIADDEEEAFGREDEFGFDGSIYYRDDSFTEREALLDAYAGVDGAYVGLSEFKPGEPGQRLAFSVRYGQFIREGFYRGLGTQPSEGLTMEAGPFYRFYTFDDNSDTDPSYTIPDDYDGYGFRTFLEQNSLVLDRISGRPVDGFIATVKVEREWNNSDERFGTPIYMSNLPSAFWRGTGHLEWFVPQTTVGTWAIKADGQWSDDEDRVFNYEAQKPQGYIWVDGELGFRFDLASFSVTPFGLIQWIRAVEEDGDSHTDETYFGGGLRADYVLSEFISFYGEYSYLENESRAPVSLSKDTFGSHQFFIGAQVSFGAVKK